MKNVAIIGLGYISIRVAGGIKNAKNACLYAVASRDINKAVAFKEKHGAKIAYGSYEEVYNDENVDLIYICTPNDTHKQYIEECLNAHKNVICEKPMVRTEEELEYLFNLAKEKNCFLMEANKTAFTPLNTYLKQKIDEGTWGKLLAIQGEYASMAPVDATEYKGNFMGAAVDIGVYPTCFVNFYADSKIKNVVGKNIELGYDVDHGFMSYIEYENGVFAQANTSWLYMPDQKGMGRLILEKAVIEIPAFWKTDTATITLNGNRGNIQRETIKIETASDFTGEVEEAISCIEQGKLQSDIMGLKQSKEIQKIVLACKKHS